jgi:predicted dehydrogenase
MVGGLIMPKFEPVRIVVVGVGDFGRRHARTLFGLAEAHLVGVVDSNQSAVESLRREVPDLQAWSTIDQAIDQSGADAYVIATRTDSHIPLAARILKSRRKVLIEKPLASDVSEGRSIENLVAADSGNMMVGHILLFSPLLRECLAQAQRRGPITFLNAVRHRPAALQKFFAEESPIRMMMVHDLYVALAAMSGDEPAQFSSWIHPSRSVATAELRWANGACGSFVASYLTPDGQPADGFDRLEVFAPGFAARVTLNPQPLEVWTEKAEWPVALDIHDDPRSPSGWLAEELRCFCRVVRGIEKVPVGARYQDALQVQSWLDKLESIAKEGQHAG